MDSVLDASALLAYFNDEPGAEVVEDALSRLCAVSSVNWAEVLTKVGETGKDADDFCSEIADQGILGQLFEVVAFDESHAREVARLRPVTREQGLSLGDRACLALAIRLGVPVCTADRIWAQIDLEIEVRVIR